MSYTSPEQPAEGQDQPVAQPDPTSAAPPPAPAAPTPAAPPEAGTAPWAADLNAVFTDDATRGQVDTFLREKVQPRVTQLEQQTSQARDALNLWNGFQEDPIQTYVQVTEELYGPEAAQAALEALQQQLDQQPETEAPQEGQPAYDPRVDQALTYVEQQQQKEWYDGEIARIQADPQYQDVDPNLLHTYVGAYDGDFDQAIEAYRRDAAIWQQRYAPATPDPEPDPAPTVMGSDSATAPTPPVQPQKQSLGDAIEDFVRESRTLPAPPVGPA